MLTAKQEYHLNSCYTTHNGVVLALSSVDRRELDKIFVKLPKPIPPTKKRVVWGGMEEEYFDHDDDRYKALYNAWLIKLCDSQLSVVAHGIELPIDPGTDPVYIDIREALGITGDDRLNYLRYVALDGEDVQKVTDIILYLSTVTQRGIDEAAALYAVEWNKQPIDTWAVKKSHAGYSAIFEHRQAARWAFIDWYHFCSLSGPDQSAIVAHYKLANRIEWLEVHGNG